MMTKYAWVIGLNAKLAPATVKLVYSYLVAVFRAAIRDRIVATSPRALNLPEVMRPLIKPLSPDEVERLQAELPERYRALVFFMAYTGLRPSEAFAVTNDRIDWMRGSLRVDRQLARNNHGIHFVATKSKKKRVRELSLPGR